MVGTRAGACASFPAQYGCCTMRTRKRSRRRTAAGVLLLCGFVGLALIPGEKPVDAGATAASATPGKARVLVSEAPIRTVAPPAAEPPATKTASIAAPDIHAADSAPDVLTVDRPASTTSTAMTSLATATPQPPEAPRPAPASVASVDPGASTAAAAQPSDGVKTARIGDLAVNVHAGPSNGAQKLFVAQPGQSVEIREVQGGWVHIVTADGASGWVYSRYIAGGMG